MRLLSLLFLLPIYTAAQTFSKTETDRFRERAGRVNIIRDTWGIPHIYGKTDADAVFGLMYTQCEDDYKRVEYNYLEMFGRLSELEGESALYDDLQMKLIYDSTAAKNDYQKSPLWFRRLMDAFADGLNYYLSNNPTRTPRLINRYEPWFALMRTDGSISATQTGGLTINDMKNLYGNTLSTATAFTNIATEVSETGSNGFAVAPLRTATKNAMLYINPHVTFYFRPEVHMVSEQGLNAYGAVTWGQFFVYQGFNEHCGWMHTSSVADVSDLYLEQITKKDSAIYYSYNNTTLPVVSRPVSLRYLSNGSMLEKKLTAYFTHHGPVLGSRNGNWLSLKEYNRSLDALMQSWLRTKAGGFKDFEKTMELKANNSNNTVFADDKGNIAYWHGNFMPVRDTSFNWTQPVDGTITATEWKGPHDIKEVIHVYNPATGWIQNCNSTPFTVSGPSSPKQGDYPAYMAPDAENFRGINAVRLLSKEKNFTLDKFIGAGYDTYLAAFEVILPPLIKAAGSGANNTSLQAVIDTLKKWNLRSSVGSVATTLAVEWGNKMLQRSRASRSVTDMTRMAETIPGQEQVKLMQEVITELEQQFGTWKVAWGEVNRFQRLSENIQQVYDDKQPSLPSGMVSSAWGCLPSFDGRRFPGVNKRYGVGGNSFVAAVEFGKTVKAKAILAGGQSGRQESKHFTDQAPLYLQGKLRDIWFYKTDVLKHVERQYRPGE
ncbi:acylase [Segetibacter sp. 3557_3]|uniref:penicillin acylase family protein n=1 Tax=Segetibacter sp. 3557_3 TaxID=2547429 RepID=UPI001058EE6F|nr:penicillin acylase family protein [Segetibacter sp. 3557_3]TDH21397.1 acylase [Segetibacter sp. 3557_3]